MSAGRSTRLSRARLQRVGGGGADGATWATRLGAALAAIALLWWTFAMVRPLPEVDGEPAASVFEAPDGLPDAAPMPLRERRLAQLIDTNLFAPDRALWTSEPDATIADEQAIGESGSEESGEPEPTPLTTVADMQSGDEAIDPFRSIELTDPETLPSKSQAKIKEVQLRAVYSLDGRPRALISLATDPANPSGRTYGVGDVIGDDEWSVLAIDARTDRVVLSREGRNFVFRLYDELPRIAASPSVRPERVMPVIERRTPEQVRRALLDSGLSEEEADELLALAMSEQEPGAQPAEDASPIPQGAPEGLEQIIELMRSNPFQQQEEKDPEGSPKDESKEAAPPAG